MRRLPDRLTMLVYTTTLTPEERKRRTALKFQLLEAANLDDALNASQFRFFFRVMSQLDIATWTSTIGYKLIGAEVPEMKDKKSAKAHRLKIEAAGYWTSEAGASGHTTRYLIAEAIPERALQLIEEKRTAYQAQREAEKRNAEKGGARPPTDRPKQRKVVGGSTPPQKGDAHPPVPFIGSQKGYREKDETPGARTPVLAPGHMPARADPVRCDCGKPAFVQVRLREAGPWITQCEECYYDDDCIAFEEVILELNQGSDRQSYAEASRGR